jgi:hypothetical protein
MVFSEAFNAAEELTKGVGHEENAGLFVEESDAGPSGLSPSSDSARPHDDETPTTDASEVALQDPPSPKIEEEPIPSPDAESIALGSAFDAESPVNMFTFTLSEEFGSTGLELPPEITVLAPDPQPVAPILAIPEVTATSMTDSETTLPVEPKHLIVSIPEAEGSDSEPEPTEHMRSDVHCHASELQAAPTEAPGISAEPAAIESEPEPEQAADSVLPHEAHAIEPARAIPDVDPTAEIARAEGPTIHLEEKPNEKTGTETGAEQPAENSPSTTAETLDATAIDPTVTDTDSVHLNPDDLEASDFLPHPENATHSQAPPVVDDHAESSEPQVHGDA